MVTCSSKYAIHTKRNGLFKGERGVEGMEFLGVLKKEHVENQGVNLKKAGIPRGVHKKPM